MRVQGRLASYDLTIPLVGEYQLENAAVATSGRDRRRWRRDGEERHHLIDPATGRPASGTPCRVTVVAGSATAAEVAATVRRVDRLLRSGVFPEPLPGRPAVPWPPV